MTEASEQQRQESVIAVGSWVWWLLGILWGTATCISFVKNGVAIDLHGLPAKAFAQYAWLRDMLFEPVEWVLRYLRLTMPWWLKDLIMAYALVAAAHARAYQVLTPLWELEPSDLLSYCRDVLLWPRTTWEHLQDWCKAKSDRKYFQTHTYGSHPDQLLPLQRAEGALTIATDQLRHIALQLFVISVATMAFFLWNYLSSAFGPS